MNIIIWKLKLKTTRIYQTIQIPKGAQILDVQFQEDDLTLWALVDPVAPMKEVEIFTIGTGMGDVDPRCVHIATIQQGSFVWHVFYRDKGRVLENK